MSHVRHYCGAFSICGLTTKTSPGFDSRGLVASKWFLFWYIWQEDKFNPVFSLSFSVLHNFRKIRWKCGLQTSFYVITKQNVVPKRHFRPTAVPNGVSPRVFSFYHLKGGAVIMMTPCYISFFLKIFVITGSLNANMNFFRFGHIIFPSVPLIINLLNTIA